MGLAWAVIVDARHASGTEVIDIVAVAAFWSRAEGQHDSLPFGPVRPDGVSMQPVSDQMSGFMWDGLSQEILRMACQDGRVVSDSKQAVGVNT